MSHYVKTQGVDGEHPQCRMCIVHFATRPLRTDHQGSASHCIKQCNAMHCGCKRLCLKRRAVETTDPTPQIVMVMETRRRSRRAAAARRLPHGGGRRDRRSRRLLRSALLPTANGSRGAPSLLSETTSLNRVQSQPIGRYPWSSRTGRAVLHTKISSPIAVLPGAQHGSCRRMLRDAPSCETASSRHPPNRCLSQSRVGVVGSGHKTSLPTRVR